MLCLSTDENSAAARVNPDTNPAHGFDQGAGPVQLTAASNLLALPLSPYPGSTPGNKINSSCPPPPDSDQGLLCDLVDALVLGVYQQLPEIRPEAAVRD